MQNQRLSYGTFLDAVDRHDSARNKFPEPRITNLLAGPEGDWKRYIERMEPAPGSSEESEKEESPIHSSELSLSDDPETSESPGSP